MYITSKKRAFIRPIIPQTVWSAAKGNIGPGSIRNVDQGALISSGSNGPFGSSLRHQSGLMAMGL
jgi:hypothetical protein